MAWFFFFLSVFGLLLTLNAHRPTTNWTLLVPSFFAAWLTNELALWAIVGQVIVTGFLVGAGALEQAVGWIGLALSVVSWIGLAHLALVASRTDRVFAAALGDLPEPDPAPHFHPAHVVFPFWLRDRRLRRAKNVQYATEFKRRHRLDVWYARRPVPTANDSGRGAPVLLQIHGGAWVIGDKGQQGRPLMFALADRGWVCVAPNYRLSPRATFPDHLIDVKLALAWVKEHIHEYGGDPDRVVVTGGSAGGHLAALTALTQNDPEYQPEFETADTSVIGCIPFYGIYDFAAVFDVSKVRARRMADFLSKLVMKKTIAEDPDLYASASPLRRVLGGAPPFLVVHGTSDTLAPVAQAREFVPALRAVSGEPVYYAELPAATHAFDVFHSIRTEHTVNGAVRFCEWLARRPISGAGVPDTSSSDPTPTARREP